MLGRLRFMVGVCSAVVIAAAQPASRSQLSPESEDLVRRLSEARTGPEIDALLVPSGVLNPELITLISKRATAASRSSDQPEAARLDQLALDLARRLHDPALQSQYALSASNSLDAAGDLARAMDISREAVSAARQAADPALIARALLRLCVVLRKSGETNTAVDTCNEAVQVAVGNRLQVEEARARNGLGLLYYSIGNVRLALDEYQKALKLAKASGQQMGIAFVENNIGTVLEAQGNFESALAHEEQSLKIKQGAGTLADQVSTLGNIALLHHDLHQDDQAVRLFRQVLDMCVKLNNTSCRAMNLFNLGVVEREQGKIQRAIGRFREAAEIGPLTDQPDYLADLAETMAAAGDTTGARPYAEKALVLARDLAIPPAERTAQSALGKIAEEEKNLPAAEAAYSAAIAITESILANVAGDEQDRQRFLEEKLADYRSLTAVLITEKRYEDSLLVAERSRSRVLREVLVSGRIQVNKGLSAEERKQQAGLRQRMEALNVSLANERSAEHPLPARLKKVEADLDAVRAEYSSLESALYAAHADLKLQRSDLPPATAAEVSASLDKKSAIVEYVVGETAVYAYVIAGGDPKVHFYSVPGTPASLVALAKSFSKQIASRNLGFVQSSRDLYQRLLEPARAVLAGKSSVVIVPDGVLWQVPFQALQAKDGHYAIEDYALSYAPSMTVLREMLRRYDRKTMLVPRVLALGNPAFPGEPPLPEAEAEVSGIAQSYGAANTSILTGSHATESAVKSAAGRYNVLHLATHGVLDDRHPMYSHVVLSPEGSRDDGWLEAWEMMNLDLKEEVVVLSGCETAQGSVSQGEGLIGMGWALFVAGTPTTVASLWKVDSESTTKLMLEFHRGLRLRLANPAAAHASGLTKAEALREAMLASLHAPETRHPFYWAGFDMLGHGF